MWNWIRREVTVAARPCAGWSAVLCTALFLLAMSGNFATDWKFIALTIVGFVVSLFAWIKLRNIK
jgi:hypothetical protein